MAKTLNNPEYLKRFGYGRAVRGPDTVEKTAEKSEEKAAENTDEKTAENTANGTS